MSASVNAPMTYRDRALAAEGRVAELEEELATWRHQTKRERVVLEDATRVALLSARIKQAYPSYSGARGAARALLCLLERPGHICGNQLIQHSLGTADDTGPEIVRVRVSQARKALEAMGFPGAIKNVWGAGYFIEAGTAATIKATLEPCA